MKPARIALPCLFLFSAALPARAGITTWLGGVDSMFDNPLNWSAGVPTDIAQFGASPQTWIFTQSGATVNTISILAGAPAYSIGGNGLTIAGLGIQNLSANPLTIEYNVFLKGSASAGNSSIIVDQYSGRLEFDQRATAGSANIQNNYVMDFLGNSNAGAATITNAIANQSYLAFYDGSSLGNATFVNHGYMTVYAGVNLGAPTITTEGPSGETHFSSSRGGGLSTFTNNNGGLLSFESASAGQATITNNSGSRSIFSGGASGGNATITNSGGQTVFTDTSDGGTAALFNIGASTLDITGVSTPGFTIGSIGGSGAVLMGSHTLMVGGNGLSTTFSGVLSGVDGSLVKTGPGVLTLSVANTYSGGTSIQGGTLRINDDANLGAAGTTLTFSSGGVLDVGPGLTSARPIQLAGDGTIMTGIASSALSGRISGPGGLTVTGAGILTLSGQNEYTGGTTIDGITLRLATPGSLPDISSVTLTGTAGSTLDMNGFDLRLSQLRGNGGQVVLGTATLTLSGGGYAYSSYYGTFTGTGKIVLDDWTAAELWNVPDTVTTEIRQGMLYAYHLGDIYISSTGYLPAIGTFQSGNCVNRGYLAFDDWAGRLASAASYAGDGTLLYTFYGNQHSTFSVAGQADVTGGKLQLMQFYRDFANGDVTLIRAGSIVGRFAVEPHSSLFEQFQMVYSSSEVHVVINVPGYTFSTFAGSLNQRAVAGVLDTSWRNYVLTNGWLLGQFAHDASSLSEVQRDYDLFGGDALASFQDIGLRHAASFMDVVRDRTVVPAAAAQSTPTVPTDRLWARGVGSFDQIKGDAGIGSPAWQATTSGFQAGYDLLAGEQMRLGISAGYLKSSLSADERQFSGQTTSVESGLYASYLHPRWFLDGAVAYIGSRNNSSRQIDMVVTNLNGYSSQLQGTPTSGFNSRTVSAMIETGTRLRPWSAVSLEPKGFLRWSRLRQDAFVESGLLYFPLSVDARTADSLLSSLGVRAACTVGKGRAHPLQLGTSADWQHELASTENEITARFDDGGPAFSVQATPRSRNAAVLGADARLAITQTLQGFFNYQYSIGDYQRSHGLSGGLRLQW